MRARRLLVAAVMLVASGCAVAPAGDARSIGEAVDVTKGQATTTTSENTTVTGVAQNTRLTVTIYYVTCAGEKWPFKGDCMKRNADIKAAWKGPDKPMQEPSGDKEKYKTGAEWAAKHAETVPVAVVLRKGDTWSLADELKNRSIPAKDSKGRIVSLFLYATITVESGSCDVTSKAVVFAPVPCAANDGEADVESGAPLDPSEYPVVDDDDDDAMPTVEATARAL